MAVLLGAIADDFTGATDLANTLVGRGMRAVQTIGLPDSDLDLGDVDAIVIALKSRTSPVADAVTSSLEALAWLRSRGVRQIVFKYCSTFDSTPSGNIGPVSDALMEAIGADLAIICPAFPAAGRRVFQGHLFVGDQLLSDSSMRDHPLTPMRDSNLVRLMAAQCLRKVGLIPHETVAAGAEVICQSFEILKKEGITYAVVDAITDHDLETIAAAAADHPLITGGSGIALGLPQNFRHAGRLTEAVQPKAPDIAGRALILAGSCSQATRAQIARAKARWPHRKLDVDRLATGDQEIEDVLAWAAGHDGEEPILIYGSADPDEVVATQARYGRECAGNLVENALGRIAKMLVDQGIRRLIVAGGETSGAVVSALGVRALHIGAEIAPGVPWTETHGEPALALALKSGNFGRETFFEDALNMLP
ncbi:MAG: 3-oxo-tetronate kinase [Pseudomonadota bacterium]